MLNLGVWNGLCVSVQIIEQVNRPFSRYTYVAYVEI